MTQYSTSDIHFVFTNRIEIFSSIYQIKRQMIHHMFAIQNEEINSTRLSFRSLVSQLVLILWLTLAIYWFLLTRSSSDPSSRPFDPDPDATESKSENQKYLIADSRSIRFRYFEIGILLLDLIFISVFFFDLRLFVEILNFEFTPKRASVRSERGIRSTCCFLSIRLEHVVFFYKMVFQWK